MVSTLQYRTKAALVLREKHDRNNKTHLLDPNHAPKADEGVRDRSLCCDVCIGVAISGNVVGVDVVSVRVVIDRGQQNTREVVRTNVAVAILEFVFFFVGCIGSLITTNPIEGLIGRRVTCQEEQSRVSTNQQ
jgi:hypothetical protein